MKRRRRIIPLIAALVLLALAYRSSLQQFSPASKVFAIIGDEQVCGAETLDKKVHLPPNVQIAELVSDGNLERRQSMGSLVDVLGRELGVTHPEPLLLIVACWSGHSLAADFRSPTGGGHSGLAYFHLMRSLETILSMASSSALRRQPSRLAGVVWWQGQAGIDNTGYGENLHSLLSDFRDNFGTPDMPVVVGETSTGASTPSAKALRREQAEAVADRPHMTFVPTIDARDRLLPDIAEHMASALLSLLTDTDYVIQPIEAASCTSQLCRLASFLLAGLLAIALATYYYFPLQIQSTATATMATADEEAVPHKDNETPEPHVESPKPDCPDLVDLEAPIVVVAKPLKVVLKPAVYSTKRHQYRMLLRADSEVARETSGDHGENLV